MFSELSVRLKKKLGLDCFPVAISFEQKIPPDMEQLKGSLRLCEMLDKARLEGESFYSVSKCHKCSGGASSCGLRKMSSHRKSGQFLVDLGLFGTARAARRLIESNPGIEFGTVKGVSFAPLDSAKFEPDVIVLICNACQAMKIAEAFAYESGKKITGLTGPPICSSVVAAPFLTGEVIYSLGDAGARKYMDIGDDNLFVGIPSELFTEIVDNLDKLSYS